MTIRKRERGSLLSTPPKLWIIIIGFVSLVLLASLFVTFVVFPQTREGTTKPIKYVTKAIPSPAPAPAPVSTVTATTTINSNSKPVPGSCLALEERYCKTVTFVTAGDGFLVAAYKLPSDTLIFSPYDGLISVANVTGGTPYYAVFYTVKAGKKIDCLCGKDKLEVLYTGVIDRKNLLASGKPILIDGKMILTHISKGEILAKTGETNLTADPPMLDKYNLVMNFTIKNHKPDDAKTKTVFGISQSK
jgi:hypothetical protein